MRRKQQSEERNAGNTKKVYLGYRINPKLIFLCLRFFFRLFVSFSLREREKKMNNTSGGGTGGGREQQQHARGNQQATTKVGSGDNGVPFTKFSSKQSKTSTVTITGTW
jgi:hypothetical protein